MTSTRPPPPTARLIEDAMPDNDYTTLSGISTHLTPTQWLVWQRLRNVTPDGLTYNSRITAEWIYSGVWGGELLPGWRGLVHIHIFNINKRISPFGVQIRGQRNNGGYRIENTESEAQ